MPRPDAFQRMIAALIAEEVREREAERASRYRSCPAKAADPAEDWPFCFHCVKGPCRTFHARGLGDDGKPLPLSARPFCGAKARGVGKACRQRVLPGKLRCRYHGGLSTGPKTAEGRARIAAAQRLRWERFRAARCEGPDGE
jgi:hypothetical protein